MALRVGLEGFLAQREQLAVGLQGQPGVGHAGHQADLRGALRLRGGEVLLHGRLVQAAQAAEQVQLPGADAEAGAVFAIGFGLAGTRQVGRQTLAGAAGIGVDLREQLGALDAVQRLVGLDVERGHAQVAIVVQRLLDQPLQRRIAEEAAPLGQRRRRRAGLAVGRAHRPGISHRCLRALVVGDQRAAAQRQDDAQGQDRLVHCADSFSACTAGLRLRSVSEQTST
ncbi:hypothetical protein D3C85_397440 [compost metagenome]